MITNFISSNKVIIVAHPDDEAISSSILIKKTLDIGANIMVIRLTHGAPYFLSAVDKNSIKIQREIESRCFDYHYKNEKFNSLNLQFEDQLLHHMMDELNKSITFSLQNLNFDNYVIITHDLEYGHPDHDTANLIVRRVSSKFKRQLYVFPLYSCVNNRIVYGKKGDQDTNEQTTIILTPEEIIEKKNVLQCFQSQKYIIDRWTNYDETFSLQTEHNLLINESFIPKKYSISENILACPKDIITSYLNYV